jgi:hypothetical protein
VGGFSGSWQQGGIVITAAVAGFRQRVHLDAPPRRQPARPPSAAARRELTLVECGALAGTRKMVRGA